MLRGFQREDRLHRHRRSSTEHESRDGVLPSLHIRGRSHTAHGRPFGCNLHLGHPRQADMHHHGG
eukprot:1002674-Pyramimonas_sp.AAC.1